MTPNSYWDTTRGYAIGVSGGACLRFCRWWLQIVESCPKNAPGKGCIRNGQFVSFRFFDSLPIVWLGNAGFARVDWRLAWLRVSERRAEDCPPFFWKEILF